MVIMKIIPDKSKYTIYRLVTENLVRQKKFQQRFSMFTSPACRIDNILQIFINIQKNFQEYS